MAARFPRALGVVAASLAFFHCSGHAADKSTPSLDPINPPPTARDWTELAKLPDWSGIWTPDIRDQLMQEKTNPPPWTIQVAAQIAEMEREEKDGRPRLILHGCLPHGMPTWMLITHNAMEILFTPGRVTMLGEGDGNRLRRIYTDGRGHPEDPDLTFFGHSIGRWEGNALLVDTVGILPEVPFAVSEAVGISNNGDLHIREKIYLASADALHVDMEIVAPKILTKPWKTTRIYYRHRRQKYDIVEGVCQQGAHQPSIDSKGNSIYIPLPIDEYGTPISEPAQNSRN